YGYRLLRLPISTVTGYYDYRLKTPLPITSTPRRAARFRKCYGKPKAHSQPTTH
ncbi:unnamed protein product, partial [Adineta ricciae]